MSEHVPVRCRRRSLVHLVTSVFPLLCACAGLDFTPSSVASRVEPGFHIDRAAPVLVLSIVDERGIERTATVPTMLSVREAALSLLREKGYAAELAGPDYLDHTGSRDQGEVLDPASVAARSPAQSRVVLAIALEETALDPLVAPRTARVRLRGIIVDVPRGASMWQGEAVAESGNLSGAASASATAATHGAVYQATRALLADLPDAP